MSAPLPAAPPLRPNAFGEKTESSSFRPPVASAAVNPTSEAGTPTKPHINLVVVGEVDHGKSTLIGRLLHDTGSVSPEKLERISAACRTEGMDFEYAFLLDAFLEEQAQNVTMDTTRVPFASAQRAFTIIDAPGHKEFLKNMVTGAAHAEAAVLLVDASQGLREQTRRHAHLLALLGIPQLVVAVNKMDLVGYDEAVFERIQKSTTEYLATLGLAAAEYVPIAAKVGEGLVRASLRTPWYRGPTLLGALEQLTVAARSTGTALRLIVQDVYRFDERRLVAGKIVSGHISEGDPITFFPGGKTSRVKSIETWPDRKSASPATSAAAGASVAFTLVEELFIERGQLGVIPEHPPAVSHEFSGRLFWLHPEPLHRGDIIELRLGTQKAEVHVVAINEVVDTTTLDSKSGAAEEIQVREVGKVRLHARRPLAFETSEKNLELARFVLMRDGRIAGGGVIDSAADKQSNGAKRNIRRSARTAHLGHRGAILWLTGLSGSGKSTLSSALERELFRIGILPVVLDGDVLRTGLCRGLGFSPEDRAENIRRAAETAVLLAETGAVVVTALISPMRLDRQRAADLARARGIPFAEIFVNASLAECERRDPKSLYKKARAGEIPGFTGVDSPYEPPLAPALELQTDQDSIDACTFKLSQLAATLAQPSDGIEADGKSASAENLI